MLKKAHDPLNQHLTLLINQTISPGVFPNALQISCVSGVELNFFYRLSLGKVSVC